VTRGETRTLARQLANTTDLIEVKRKGFAKAGRLIGFVVAAGKEWLLLHEVDPDLWMLDGHVAVRLRHVTQLIPCLYKGSDYPTRVLRHFGEDRPHALPEIDLSSVRTLVKTAAATAPLIGIECEKSAPKCAFFGVPLKMKKGVLTLRDINVDGRWDPTPSKHRLSDITRVQVGTRYEQALAAIGGPTPTDR
jgi:hypothetical protein